MLNYPEVMRRAQEELDTVVGRGRIPSFADADNLPYIRAIVRETLRWHPVSPLGVWPHCICLIYSSHNSDPGLPHVATEVYSAKLVIYQALRVISI